MAKTKPVENIVTEFVNPFKAGVSYSDFANALGDKSVSEYLNGQFKTEGVEFTSEDIEWLTQEIETHKNK